jgi:hypothetical protein
MWRICMLMLIGFLMPADVAAAEGQGTARTFVYSDIAFGVGGPMAFRATANCLFLKHHEIGLGYNSYWRKGPDVPAGAKYYHIPGGPRYYSSSSDATLTTYPQETISGLALTYAFVLYPKKKPDELRYLLRAGILLGRRSNPYDLRK